MNWFLSIFIGLLTAVIGLFSAGFLANLNVRWYRISSFEGGSGYYVVGIALMGGFVGLIIGIICARLVAGWPDPSFLKGIALAAGSMLGFVVVIGVICRLAADLPPEIDGKSLELAVEIKCPQNYTIPQEVDEYGAARVSLIRGRGLPAGKLQLREATQVDGRWIIPATVPLTTSATQKFLHVYIDKGANHSFALPLRAHPREKDLSWSHWQEGGWSPGTERPRPENNFLMRFRVQAIKPPPPGPTQGEIDALRATEEQATLEAIPANAPITAWLPYTQYGTDPERLARAIGNISSRERFVDEIGALAVGNDHKTAAAAMWMTRHLEGFPAELNEAIADTGRKIAEMIRTFNATPVEQDPSMQGAADISVRFHSWIEAVRTLRKNSDGDFTAELHEILKLSREREDSHCMQADVRRFASYYIQEWAGVAPVTGDPRPR